MSSETLTFQPPHPHNAKEKEYLKLAPPKEQELQALATQMLGSSHFVGKTHGFKQASPTQPPPKAK